jgi:hypothetical protein
MPSMLLVACCAGGTCGNEFCTMAAMLSSKSRITREQDFHSALGVFGVVLILFAGGGGCGIKIDPIPCSAKEIGQLGPVSYSDDIRVLMENNCKVCHSSNRVGLERYGAPEASNFDTYEQTRAQGAQVVARTIAETMPPLGPSLSRQKRCLLQAWGEQEHPP